MGIFSFFRSKPKGSASTAKERLQVLIAHQHSDSDGPEYLPLLKQDILNVIKKYVDIGEEQVSVQLDSQDDCDILELNITLPEDGDRSGKHLIGSSAKTTSASAKSKLASLDDDDSLSLGTGNHRSAAKGSRKERTRARQTQNKQAMAKSKASS